MTETAVLQWEFGTAYELFISLLVLQDPEFYGVRASWAAGVRSRIPTAERKFLEEAFPFFGVPLAWIHNLPEPKDAISVLYALRSIPAEKRAWTLLCLDKPCEEESKQEIDALRRVSERRAWDEQDLKDLAALTHLFNTKRDEADLKRYLDLWANPGKFGEALLSALQAYQQAFFEEEEKRITPVLRAALENAKALSQTMSIPDLLAELSQGVHMDISGIQQFILGPAYWSTPLIFYEKLDGTSCIFLFGARPATMSATPGELVPDGLLHSLKALADSTRLKILYYLSQEELTPSELSRRLHLRAPTLTHHLGELRLAGLVNLTVKGQEKFYSTRREALRGTFENLDHFLDSQHS
jgi:DNA-binding transcriptional ArsR family regulator